MERLNTPVLYLVFNRLDTVKKTFPEIRKSMPAELFVAADGPRNLQERKKTDSVRKYILENIDWKCKVKTLFRKKNLGCKNAVSQAIDWFFKNVEYGIILEDDCFPSQSFFRFCQELLIKYRDDDRIMQISGTNIEGVTPISQSYFFTRNFNPWGWASWRRAWVKYDSEIESFQELQKSVLYKKLKDPPFKGFKGRRLYRILKANKIDTWDYQWIYTCLINSGFSIIPRLNLIENLGFESGATHTTSYGSEKKLKIHQIKFPLKENIFIMENNDYAKKYKKFFNRGLIKRLFAKYAKKFLWEKKLKF